MSAQTIVVPENARLVDTILEVTRRHVGKEDAISLEGVMRHLRFHNPGYIITQTFTRALIHDMRQAGYLIGSCVTGYFFPATLAEAKEYVELVFRERARDELLTARIQRAAAGHHFGGQSRFT